MLASLTNLVTQLALHNNQIFDISPLTSLTKLELLSLDNNQIFDISPLRYLTKLNYVFFMNNPIRNRSCLLKSESLGRF
ncbi:hypothetical protein [Microcoleus sp. OTE_8_concoct_300]|uniref:hypothetical protein n=1 Tax=Microcoleus sp. OTE_8_concoct_300 TaxID=2964710 RepID=UPI00403F8B8B